MHIILKTSLYISLLIFSNLLAAETMSDAEPLKASSTPQQHYIVELILFKHLNEEGKQDEFWFHPEDGENNPALTERLPENHLTDDNAALAEYDLQDKNFLPLRNGVSALSPSDYKLNDSAIHIDRSKNFQLLAHFGWTQPSLSQQSALPIRLKPKQFSDEQDPSGTIKLHVTRYLHLEVALSSSQCEYMMPLQEAISDAELDQQLAQGTSALERLELAQAPTDNQQCVNNTYLFKQKRKMKSKELHYLDNPVYGLLVYITPLTVEE